MFAAKPLFSARAAVCAAAVVFALISAAPRASSQWNPQAGQWGKVQPADLRVMTWNVRHTRCSTNSKTLGRNNRGAAARIVAALRPDVLILKECGDNSGNGTGSSVDSVTALQTTIGYFPHGGNDSFKPGNPPVTACVQLFAPSWDLPHVFVTTENDGFNRNVILSRRPFVDLNGDGQATMQNIPTIGADFYSPGGTDGTDRNRTDMTLACGAKIVPQGPLILGPFTTDPGGSCQLVFAGGGPLPIVVQWGIVDQAANGGFALANAVGFALLP